MISPDPCSLIPLTEIFPFVNDDFLFDDENVSRLLTQSSQCLPSPFAEENFVLYEDFLINEEAENTIEEDESSSDILTKNLDPQSEMRRNDFESFYESSFEKMNSLEYKVRLALFKYNSPRSTEFAIQVFDGDFTIIPGLQIWHRLLPSFETMLQTSLSFPIFKKVRWMNIVHRGIFLNCSVLQINAEHCKFTNSKFQEYVFEVISKKAAKLLLGGCLSSPGFQLSCKFQKLVFNTTHWDNTPSIERKENEENSFATLVIQLPSIYPSLPNGKDGQIDISYLNRFTKTINFNHPPDSNYTLRVACFLNSAKYAVDLHPISSPGHVQSLLVYSLIANHKVVGPTFDQLREKQMNDRNLDLALTTWYNAVTDNSYLDDDCKSLYERDDRHPPNPLLAMICRYVYPTNRMKSLIYEDNNRCLHNDADLSCLEGIDLLTIQALCDSIVRCRLNVEFQFGSMLLIDPSEQYEWSRIVFREAGIFKSYTRKRRFLSVPKDCVFTCGRTAFEDIPLNMLSGHIYECSGVYFYPRKQMSSVLLDWRDTNEEDDFKTMVADAIKERRISMSDMLIRICRIMRYNTIRHKDWSEISTLLVLEDDFDIKQVMNENNTFPLKDQIKDCLTDMLCNVPFEIWKSMKNQQRAKTLQETLFDLRETREAGSKPGVGYAIWNLHGASALINYYDVILSGEKACCRMERCPFCINMDHILRDPKWRSEEQVILLKEFSNKLLKIIPHVTECTQKDKVHCNAILFILARSTENDPLFVQSLLLLGIITREVAISPLEVRICHKTILVVEDLLINAWLNVLDLTLTTEDSHWMNEFESLPAGLRGLYDGWTSLFDRRISEYLFCLPGFWADRETANLYQSNSFNLAALEEFFEDPKRKFWIYVDESSNNWYPKWTRWIKAGLISIVKTANANEFLVEKLEAGAREYHRESFDLKANLDAMVRTYL